MTTLDGYNRKEWKTNKFGYSLQLSLEINWNKVTIFCYLGIPIRLLHNSVINRKTDRNVWQVKDSIISLGN